MLHFGILFTKKLNWIEEEIDHVLQSRTKVVGTLELGHISPIPPNQCWKISRFFHQKEEKSPDYQHCKWGEGRACSLSQPFCPGLWVTEEKITRHGAATNESHEWFLKRSPNSVIIELYLFSGARSLLFAKLTEDHCQVICKSSRLEFCGVVFSHFFSV